MASPRSNDCCAQIAQPQVMITAGKMVTVMSFVTAVAWNKWLPDIRTWRHKGLRHRQQGAAAAAAGSPPQSPRPRAPWWQAVLAGMAYALACTWITRCELWELVDAVGLLLAPFSVLVHSVLCSCCYWVLDWLRLAGHGLARFAGNSWPAGLQGLVFLPLRVVALFSSALLLLAYSPLEMLMNAAAEVTFFMLGHFIPLQYADNILEQCVAKYNSASPMDPFCDAFKDLWELKVQQPARMPSNLPHSRWFDYLLLAWLVCIIDRLRWLEQNPKGSNAPLDQHARLEVARQRKEQKAQQCKQQKRKQKQQGRG